MNKKKSFILLAIIMFLISVYAATVNIVPRADGEGGIGTSAKRWLNGYFGYVYASYVRIVDSATQIYEDGSGNMCFEDAVSGALTLAELNSGGGATSEAELEIDLTDVTDVFTNNDGALDDDDVTDDNVESMATAGGAGTAPVSDGASGLAMTDIWTESENTAAAYIGTAGVTYENLNTNGDVGTGAAQVAAGDHNHSGVYEPVLTDKASLESTISDVSDFAEADGDTWTGVHDMGGADSLEVPNGAAPTVNATGEMAVDTDCITQGMLVMYAASAKVYTVATTDTPADNEIPKYDSTSGTITWEADESGSGSGLWRLDLPIQAGKLGGGDITNPMAIDGGNRPWYGLFDDSTDEEAVWQFVMGNDYAGGDILVTIVFSCAATQSGDKDVEFDAKFMATTPNSDSEDFNSDGYDAVQTVDHDLATNQTAGYPRSAQITFTVTQADEIAAGDACRFHLMRDVSTADDATDDVEVIGVILEEQS